MKRLTPLLTILLSVWSSAKAQNRIDEFVENISNAGTAKFTSVVERDPQTREIIKTVKTLELDGNNVNNAWQVFEQESKHENVIETHESNTHTCILKVTKENEVRIYMITSPTGKETANITIIVKRKE